MSVAPPKGKCFVILHQHNLLFVLTEGCLPTFLRAAWERVVLLSSQTQLALESVWAVQETKSCSCTHHHLSYACTVEPLREGMQELCRLQRKSRFKQHFRFPGTGISSTTYRARMFCWLIQKNPETVVAIYFAERQHLKKRLQLHELATRGIARNLMNEVQQNVFSPKAGATFEI